MSYLNSLKNATNYGYTENGAVKHLSTGSAVLDMFAFGGSFRNRSDMDCINLFKEAFEEDDVLALKCLFYLRDCRGGQGQRRFFRVCMNWLANTYPERARYLVQYIPEYGRWDDLFALYDTKVESNVIDMMREQLKVDMTTEANGISLLAKWCKSENGSSPETKRLARKTRNALGVSAKQYRQMLSKLRAKINVLERLMSENRWNEIEYDHIPSRAGIIYRNAFARHDIQKRYEEFAKSDKTTVNASVLYPQEIAARAFSSSYLALDDPKRLMLQKYWDALPNYYGDRQENGIAVVDVSGSMYGTPLEAAVSLGAYVAEKAHGPFANHFITFSSSPELIKFSGVDIVDKFNRAKRARWGMNTNIEAVFDLLLTTALKNNTPQEDMPNRLYIFSDMEFDYCISNVRGADDMVTLIESMEKRWNTYGYELPEVVFWNLDARNNNIPAMGTKFSYVSGFSPVMIEQILGGKTGMDLMLEKLNTERYAVIR